MKEITIRKSNSRPISSGKLAETIVKRLIGAAMLALGAATVPILDGDITVLVGISFFALPFLFSSMPLFTKETNEEDNNNEN